MEGVETTEGWLQLKVQSVRAAQGCSALPEALSAVVVSGGQLCSAAERSAEGAAVDVSHLMAVLHYTTVPVLLLTAPCFILAAANRFQKGHRCDNGALK